MDSIFFWWVWSWRPIPRQTTAVGSGDPALSGARDQSQNDQQDNGPNKGVDDRSNNATADCYANPRQQPASDECADNPNDDVADQPETTAFNHHAGKPTGDGTYDQPVIGRSYLE
jgi:hypothetical protein